MQEKYDRCPNCMGQLINHEDACPVCGFDVAGYEERKNCLRPFTVLQNKYMIGRVIGVGGFGITYIGWDLNLQTYIAIKEYFPDSLASRDTGASAEATRVIPNESRLAMYEKGLKGYVGEARSLSKFYQLQGIVSVKDFFYENGTGYIVMEYINGINLKEYLNNVGGRLDENTVLALMKPVLESLFVIHNSGVIHRDISPDNIMVDNNNKIKLIDFGSARGQAAEGDKTYTVILKHGYAPAEQYYAKGNQGPWTDIYSLCATMYKMLTGNLPPNSVERMSDDEYVDPSAYGVNVSPRTTAVLRRGLAVRIENRYQNLGELINDLYGSAPINAPQNSVPLNNPSGYVNQISMSQQSMHLSMQPAMSQEDNKKAGKKKIIIIGCIAAAVLIAVIVFLVIFFKNRDKENVSDDKKTAALENSSETEATEDTGNTDTPDTSEPEEPESVYVWPEKLSDNWRDLNFSINGTVYTLPIPYDEWVAQGWKSDYLPTHIPGEGAENVEFNMNGIELDAILYNYYLDERPINEAYIVSVTIYSEYVSDNVEVALAGGIKLGQATEKDIKDNYGAPDNYYEGSYDISMDYVGYSAQNETGNYDMENGMELSVDIQSGFLSTITIFNPVTPEGLVISADDISTDVPEINLSYAAPAGPSTDRFDSIITVDGVNYLLPVPVSVLIENGWEISQGTQSYISGNDYIYMNLVKGGSRISVTADNSTPSAIVTPNAMVTSIQVDASYCDLDVQFPGGMCVGKTAEDFEGMYYDVIENDYIYDGLYGKSYSVWGYDGNDIQIYINAQHDYEKGYITKYEYSVESY